MPTFQMIIKTSLSSLRPGMRIVNPGLEPQDEPGVYLADVLLEDLQQLDAIRLQNYSDAFIDTEEGSYFQDHPDEKERIENLFLELYGEEQAAEGGAVAEQASFDAVAEVFPEADAKYSEMLSYCREFLNNLRRTSSVDVEASEAFVDSIIRKNSVESRAMYLLSKLRMYDEYSYTHSLNVSLLATMFGKSLGLSHTNLMQLGLAGLYHDVGKLRVPAKIVKKPGKLNATEMAEMKRHPEYSKAMLEKQGGICSAIVRTVYEHHERFDGKGYPQGLPKSQLAYPSLLMGIVDCFDALTSDRDYSGSVHQHRAICILFNQRGAAYSPVMVDHFVRFMGIYPVGSIVVFKNGRKGIVIEQNPSNLLLPRVRVILDVGNHYISPEDISLEDVGGNDSEYAITGCLSNKECRIHIDAFLLKQAV